MLRRKDLRMDRSLKQIMKERFVHSLSKEVYDKVATLWHIDRESEKLMSQIASKVVVGFFCLEYLSYIHTLIKEKAGIKDNISASDLSDEDLVADVMARLSDNKEAALIFKSAACRLKKIIDSVNITTLEDLTRVAHTGDYLLSALKDMKDYGHDEYKLWLSSIPYYYEKDLEYLGLIKTGIGLLADSSVFSSVNYAPSLWSEQIPAESWHFEKIYSDHRVNLNAHLSPDTTDKGYFPCIKSKGRNRRPFSRG